MEGKHSPKHMQMASLPLLAQLQLESENKNSLAYDGACKKLESKSLSFLKIKIKLHTLGCAESHSGLPQGGSRNKRSNSMYETIVRFCSAVFTFDGVQGVDAFSSVQEGHQS